MALNQISAAQPPCHLSTSVILPLGTLYATGSICADLLAELSLTHWEKIKTAETSAKMKDSGHIYN